MSRKKTTVNITSDNHMKIQQIQQETGLTQSEIINQAIAEIPVIVLGNQKTLAENFFEIRKLISRNNAEEINEEVAEACQLLNSLMAKIAELKH